MKKRGIFFFLFMFVFHSVFAVQRTESEARGMAAEFLKSLKMKRNNRAISSQQYEVALKSAFVSEEYFVFNGENEFAIVSQNSDNDIIAYSTNHAFDVSVVPEELKTWLKSVAISAANSVTHSAVEPMIKTKWGYSRPYNLQVNGKAINPIAVAMAQIMAHYRWPQDKTKKVNDLEATTFNWDILKDEYEYYDEDESAQEVSKLMKYCGDAIHTNYNDISRAYVCTTGDALKYYFNYEKTVREIYRAGYTNSEWDNMIYGELANGRPVIYHATSNKETTSLIIDGYDEKGFYHANWGMSGDFDGYYKLPALNYYSMDHVATIGIQKAATPYEYEHRLASVIIEEWSVWSHYQRDNDHDLQVGIKLSWEEGYTGAECWSNDIYEPGAGLYKNHELVKVLPMYTVTRISDRPKFIYAATLDSSIPDGHYQLKPLYRKISSIEWMETVNSDGQFFDLWIADNAMKVVSYKDVYNSADKDDVEVLEMNVVGDMLYDSPQVLNLKLQNKGLATTGTLNVIVSSGEGKDYYEVCDERVGFMLDPGETGNVEFPFSVPKAGEYQITIEANRDVIASKTFFFSEVSDNDYDLNVSQITTASTYVKDGQSEIFALATNKSKNKFHGKMRLKLVNAENSSDERTVDGVIHIPADSAMRAHISYKFDFAGSYKIKEVELWGISQTQEHRTALVQETSVEPFTVISSVNPGSYPTLLADAEIASERSYKNDRVYVNDSIFKGELFRVEYNITKKGSMGSVNVEFWAHSIKDRKNILLEQTQVAAKYEQGYSNAYSTFAHASDGMPAGDYRLILFARIDGHTVVLNDRTTTGYAEDRISENILHVFEPKIPLPKLNLKKLYVPSAIYYDDNNVIELEIENTGSDFLFTENDYDNERFDIMEEDVRFHDFAPFAIKSGQTASIAIGLYPYSGTKKVDNKYLVLKKETTERCIILPIGKISTSNILQKRTNKINVSGCFFLSKDKESPWYGYGNWTSLYQNGKKLITGTVKRSLWQNGNQIKQLSDLELSNNYTITPDVSEVNDVPAGVYVLHIALTTTSGTTYSVEKLPLIVDERDNGLSIQSLEVETDHDLDYSDEIPIAVTIDNTSNENVRTYLRSNLSKVDSYGYQMDYYGYMTTEVAPHGRTKVILPMQIKSEKNKSNGEFLAQVWVCHTARESGMLDFGRYSYEWITLPYIYSGIDNVMNNNDCPKQRDCFSLDGKRLSTPQRGLNIVRMSDGTTKKVVKK